MARVCDLTGKRRLVANKVSHAKNRTKTRKEVNLHRKRIFDPESGETVTLRISAKGLRTLDKLGSITKFLRKFAHQLA